LTVFLGRSGPPAGAHGVLGQNLARPRDGALDAYPEAGEYTTRAQAEGALDGAFGDYAVASPFATGFRFSRFDAAEADAGRAAAEASAAAVV
jgi:hypothetical protein